jgi:hypothetical protein
MSWSGSADDRFDTTEDESSVVVHQGEGLMKIEHGVLVVLVAMWAVALLLMVFPEVQGAGGVGHPKFETMEMAGSGVAHDDRTLWLGWVYGLCTLLTAVSLMALGARKRGQLGGLGPKFVAAALGPPAVLAAIVLSYLGYVDDSAPRMFFGFPAPTAIMLYLFFPATIVFNLLYVWSFDRWFLSNDDMAAFERLVAERRERLGAEMGTNPSAGEVE